LIVGTKQDLVSPDQKNRSQYLRASQDFGCESIVLVSPLFFFFFFLTVFSSHSFPDPCSFFKSTLSRENIVQNTSVLERFYSAAVERRIFSQSGFGLVQHEAATPVFGAPHPEHRKKNNKNRRGSFFSFKSY